MTLIVDFRNCEKETQEELNKYQFEIGSYMAVIGMSKITCDNYKEVYARLVVFNASIFDNSEPWLNLDMCQALIGAKFNINDESKSQFSTRMLNRCIEDIDQRETKSQEVA